LSELFPVETRAIGVSLGFSTAVTIFGGFAPFVATWLIVQTGNPLSPSYYLIFTALLSLAALIAIQRRGRRAESNGAAALVLAGGTPGGRS
jgi:MHS family proline/betaine transporter-like MFS transporter